MARVLLAVAGALMMMLALFAAVAEAVVPGGTEVRLMDGTNVTNGRLEVRFRGSSDWGTVCSYGFDTTDATVACRSLGLLPAQPSYSTPYTADGVSAAFGNVTAANMTVLMQNVRCSSSATTFSQCSYSAVTSTCRNRHNRVVVLFCQVPTESFALRLTNLERPGVGRLEIQRLTATTPRWGAVCSQLNAFAAVTACRHLGYDVREARFFRPSTSTETLRVAVTTAYCPSNASRWNQCTVYGESSSYCGSPYTLDCTVNQTEYRLWGPYVDSGFGLLQVRPNSTAAWGTVCDDSFGTNDASVACASLRGRTNEFYPGRGRYATRANMGSEISQALSVNGPIYMDDLACTSINSELAECNQAIRHNCGHGEDVVLACHEDVAPEDRVWTINLTDGPSNKSGLLMVRPSDDSPWGTVCDDNFDAVAAVRACRSVGFVNVSQAAFSRSSGPKMAPVWMDNVACLPGAGLLENCSFLFNSVDCSSHTEDIFLDCATDEREVRLVNGPTASEGQLQIRMSAGEPWRGVCYSGFSGIVAAQAMCRAVLNRTEVHASYTTLQFARVNASDSQEPVVSRLTCDILGLPSCQIAVASTAGTCAGPSQVFVSCSDLPRSPEWEMRLVDGLATSAGRLEVRPSPTSAWGTVCDDNFLSSAATTMCRALGFDVDFATWQQAPRLATGPVWLENVRCSSQARSLGDCTYTYPTTDCVSHTEDVYVDCGAGLWEQRLVGSDGTTEVPSSGALQLRANASDPWVPVCYATFGSAEGELACRALGFGSGAAVSSSRVETGSPSATPVTGMSLNCLSSHVLLAQCTRTATTCAPYDFVQLACTYSSDALRPWEYRLAPSATPGRGLLQVRPNPAVQWGTVCDDYFSSASASAACRSLGLGSGMGATYFRTSGTGPVYMDNVRCESGQDRFLTNCSFLYLSGDCSSHREDIGVDCRVGAWEYRLRGGPSDQHGLLEARPNSTAQWGTVCASNFGLREAAVACAGVGAPESVASFQRASSSGLSFTASERGGAWLLSVSCSSTAVSNLLRCSVIESSGVEGIDAVLADMLGASRLPVGIASLCNASGDAVVLRCDARPLSTTLSWELELSDRGSQPVGDPLPSPRLVRVRPTPISAWGTICNDNFAIADAITVCKTLGFVNASWSNLPSYSTSRVVDRTRGPIWVDNLACSAIHQTLGDCSFNFAGTDCADHTEDIEVDCQASQWEFRLVRNISVPVAPVGRVELRPNSSAPWGTVCSKHVDFTTLQALCNTLGYGSAIPSSMPFSLSTVGVPAISTSEPIWIQGMSCPSASSSVPGCSRSVHSDCTHADDLVIDCFTPPVPPQRWEFRFLNASLRSGPVQVRPSPNAPWGYMAYDSTFRSSSYDNDLLICRELGYDVSRAAHYSAGIRADGPMWISRIACTSGVTRLDDCASTYPSTTCTSCAAAAVDCTNGVGWGIRLVDSTGVVNSVVGRLEVRPNSTAPWGTVCDDGFGSQDALTTCLTLGHTAAGLSASVTSNSPFRLPSSDRRPIYLDDMACTPSDTFLPFCSGNFLNHNCGRSEDVAVSCTITPSQANVRWEYRLVESTAPGSGRLEVRPGPQARWGTVCDDYFGQEEAVVACRALGFDPSTAEADYRVAAGSGPIWIDDLRCEPSASDFAQCSYRYNSHNCGHSEDVGLRCGASSYTYRLFANPSTPNRGRIMVQINETSVFGGICDVSFTAADATALCKAVRPQSVLGRPIPNIGGDVSPMWASSITCAPQAGSASECTLSVRSDGNACPVSESVGVECELGDDLSSWAVTVADSSATRNGFTQRTPTITTATGSAVQLCADGISPAVGAVLCRSMGVPTTASALVSRVSISSSMADPLLNVDYRCPAAAQSITQCTATPRAAMCTHTADLVCGVSWEFRIGDGTGKKGILWVRPSPSVRWGTVCDDFFAEDDAWAACRSLGFNPLAVGIDDDVSSSGGSGPIWLDDVDCSGADRLEHCNFKFDTANCGHYEDVSLDCGKLPGWLIAIIVIACLIVFAVLVYAVWWLCTKEEREARRREQEFQRELDARAGPLDAAAQQALFDDDIPAELRPMADVAGVALVGDDDPQPQQVPKFVAPALADDPDLGGFHATQRAMVACARGETAGVVRVHIDYIMRATRRFSTPSHFKAATHCCFDAWDLAGGLVYPTTLILAPVRKSIRKRVDRVETATHANVAQIIGAGDIAGPQTEAMAADAGLVLIGDHRRTVSCMFCEVLPKHFTLAAMLSSSSAHHQQLPAAVCSKLVNDIIAGVRHLSNCGMRALISLDTIAMRDGTWHSDPVVMVPLPLDALDDEVVAQALVRVSRQLCQAAGLRLLSEAAFGHVTLSEACDRLYMPNAGDTSHLRRRRQLTPHQFAEDIDCAVHIELECGMCGVTVHSSGYHLHGTDCSEAEQHFTCSDCINTRVSALLTEDAVDMAELPCPMGCGGMWDFDDFGALVAPRHLRQWQRLSIERTKKQALEAAKEIFDKLEQEAADTDRDPDVKAVREHVAAIRKLLRPACPYCGMAFESFSGCLSVTCGAKDRNGRQVSGCGNVFCGGCMTRKPCPKDCGHAFINVGELHQRWRIWRMQRPTEYLREHFNGGPKDNHPRSQQLLGRVLAGVRRDLEVVGVWPLPGFNV